MDGGRGPSLLDYARGGAVSGILMQNREVELKFSCAPAAMSLIEAHSALSAALACAQRFLVTTYFDTPDHALAKVGFVCRIRSEGDTRVQTVKAVAEGPFARHEWESPIAGSRPDLSLVPRSRINRILRKDDLAARLAPVFTIEIARRCWNIVHGTSQIELSLDVGAVKDKLQSLPLCEVELELKQGELSDVFDLARTLCAEIPLHLDLRSKATQAFGLIEGRTPLESAPPVPALSRRMFFVDGFRALAYACLQPLATNAPILRSTQDAEALHQTRTAVRRLRALLRIFARQMEDDEFTRLQGEFKWLSKRLGSARDLDVARLSWAAHQRTADLAHALDDRRKAAYARVLATLDMPRARLMLIDFCTWLAFGHWTTQSPRKRTRGAFYDICMRESLRWDKKLRKTGAGLDDLDPDARHRLRIRAKSFTYFCELTGELAEQDRPAQRAYLKSLKRLQSTLGEINDAEVARKFLAAMESTPALASAVSHAAKRNRRNEAKLLRKMGAAYKRFATAPRPWAAR